MKKIFALVLYILLATPGFAADVGGLELNGSYVIDNFGGTLSYNNFTIDSDGGSIDSLAFLTQVEFSDVITTVCFRYGLRTGTPVAHRVSIQGVNTAAFGPDGTILGGGTPASAAFTPPASTAWDGTGQCVTLDNSLTVSRGDFLAFVIEPTGTPDGSNKSTFTQSIENMSWRRYMPVSATKTNGGSWTKNEHSPVFWYKSATRVYGLPSEAITVGGAGVSVDSSPDEYGNAFKLPAGSCDTFKVRGMDCQFDNIGNANKDVRFALYAGVTSASSLNSITVNSNSWGADGGSYRNIRILFPGTSTDLTCGSTYVISWAPQSTSSGMNYVYLTMDAVADLGAYVLGTSMYLVTRTDNAANFTTATDSRLFCVPIIEDITEPSGSGGPTGKVQGLNEGFN